MAPREYCPACYMHLGTSLTSCACGWKMLDPMPRQDLELPPPVGFVLRAEHDRLMAEKGAEIARLREALTPSAETKAAYWSEVECDCPTETWRHYVPWTSIKQIMKMIRARAALKGDSDE